MVSRFVSRERNRVECSPVWPMMAAFVPRFHPSDSRVESNRTWTSWLPRRTDLWFLVEIETSVVHAKAIPSRRKLIRSSVEEFLNVPFEIQSFSKQAFFNQIYAMCLREERRKLDPPGAVKKSKIMEQGWKVGRDIGWSVSRHKEQRPFPLSSNLVL